MPDERRRGLGGNFRARPLPSQRIDADRSRTRKHLRDRDRNPKKPARRPMIRAIVRSILERALARRNRAARTGGLMLVYGCVIALSLWLAYGIGFHFALTLPVRRNLPLFS